MNPSRKKRNDMNPEIDDLRRDIAEHAHALRELKRRLRSPWRAPMGDVQRQALSRAAEVTALLCLRAWLRGRWHLPDHERCHALALQASHARGMRPHATTEEVAR
jgi:hypothetical protein